VPEEVAPVDLNALMKEIVQSFGDELSKNRIDVKLNLAPDLPVVRGALDKLKQVFLNLVLNARDAMPQGGLLRIGTTRENGFVKISVCDTGVGIPKENLDKILMLSSPPRAK